MKNMRKEEGFTLIELMIVVAIIAIIAAIAIPSLLNARKAGNEASAISSLRTLTTVNEQYRTRFQNYSDDLSDLNDEGYIDSVLGAGQKSGYTFEYRMSNGTWTCSASPVSEGNDGDRHFFVDQSGIIRFNATSEANASSNPIDSGSGSSSRRR
ncbi:MAG: prepilin-type N-terminal cleavage/methylation domain-containing protein [Planctomycetota bacterium]|nr:prepilin-type N-terminal cleavage/methylation domain-containing protein [Planctomycetota bacterium]MEE3180347.1 prepilin-type N-terminal cleavage/methylation domain-containing protein [Planctomycetota bacterium]MEE3199806.1 prepilin-type N-terminal cleavage/methylation domain-containing protein [Planctomycetota bacterium]